MAPAAVFLSTFVALLLSTLLAASSTGDKDESCPYTASDIDSDWASVLSGSDDGVDIPPSFGAVPVVGTVKRYAWNHTDPDFNRKMMAHLTPVILTDSPVSKWAAIGKWTPDYVAEVVGHDTPLYATFSSDGNFLFHSESKAKTADPSYFPPNKYYKIKQEPHGDFYKLEHELQPRSMLCYEDDCKNTRLHIWFGAGGVRSLPHFDISQNFFAQIFGHKTFYLAPPSDESNFLMLPNGHPSSRHTSLKWPVSDAKVVEKTDLRLFRADLGPGDLLLIPSLWIHTTEVEGDEPSLGFSMWNPGFSVWRNRVRELAEKTCEMEIKRLRADSVMIPSARLGAAVWTEAVSLAKQFFADSSSASTKELDKFLLRFRPEVCSVIGDDRTFFEDDETSAREDPSKIPLTCIDESRALLFDDKRLREIMERDVLERVDFGGKPALLWHHVEGLAQGLLGERGACEFFSHIRERLIVDDN